MAVYKRKANSDTWHFCTNCSLYPTGSDVVTSNTRPTSGELCNQCKAKQDNGTCK